MIECQDYNRLPNFYMKNIVFVTCRKLVPLAYVLVQTCLGLTILELGLNQNLLFITMGIASLAYFIVCFKDPGYVSLNECKLSREKQEEKREGSSPRRLIDSESPRSPNSDQQSKKEDPLQVMLQLGLQSKLSEVHQNANKPNNNINLPPQVKRYDKIIKHQDRIIEQAEQKVDSISVQLQKIKRWCKECDHPQQLRVRHCLECKRCVMTFDHHCPWINNCIGQKNRLALILYLVLQIVQLVALAVDLGLSFNRVMGRQSLLLELILIALAVGIAGVLFFQLYLVSNNLTTWQHLRWDRIEYLSIFQQQKLISLFDQGLKANLSSFLSSNCTKQPTNWQKHISVQVASCFRTAKSILSK